MTKQIPGRGDGRQPLLPGERGPIYLLTGAVEEINAHAIKIEVGATPIRRFIRTCLAAAGTMLIVSPLEPFHISRGNIAPYVMVVVLISLICAFISLKTEGLFRHSNKLSFIVSFVVRVGSLGIVTDFYTRGSGLLRTGNMSTYVNPELFVWWLGAGIIYYLLLVVMS